MKKYTTRIWMVLGIDLFLLMEIFLMPSHPLAGWVLLLFAVVNCLLCLILRTPDTGDKPKILNPRELNGMTRILRYAAAALSFISLLTTSTGMRAFIFGPGQEWMAYVTSFAVQSVLMVFGMLLCHIYSTIGNLDSLSLLGRRLLLGGLTLFFAASVVMSSTFSYAFMAENAYQKSWDSDSETIIQTNLIQETSRLEDENERIGGLLLEDILGSVQESLLPAAQEYRNMLQSVAAQTVERLQPQNLSFDESEVSIDPYINALNQRYPNFVADMQALRTQYKQSYIKKLQEAVNRYNEIATELRGLSVETAGTAEENLKTDPRTDLENCRIELEAISSNITSLRTAIDTLVNSRAIYDLSALRGSFQAEADRIVNHIGQTIDQIDKAYQELETAYGAFPTLTDKTVSDNSSMGSGDIHLAEIDSLQRDILLLKARQLSSESGDASEALDDAAVSDIISRIMNLIQDLSNIGTLPAESIEPMANLSEQVVEYGKYANLAQGIRVFRDSRLAKSYYFSGANAISREIWHTERDQDFHTFFTLLNSLPTISDKSDYEAIKILHSLSVLHRDLLGDITDLERAFNYFKYEFGKMAYFSAFVAVFLDLGTFFTGCFLYGTRYIQHFMEKLKENNHHSIQKDSSREDPDDPVQPNGEPDAQNPASEECVVF